MKLGVTGHRPEKIGGYDVPNPIYDHIMSEVQAFFTLLNPEYVFTGMAQGFDQWIAELCVSRGIKFVAAIPFEGQERVWPAATQRRYHWLLERAAYKVIVCAGEYAPEKMQIRNQWIVDNVDAMLAAWDGSAGGTANCVHYAESVGKIIHRINTNPLPQNQDSISEIPVPGLLGPTGLPVSDWSRQTITPFDRIRRSIEATERAAANSAQLLEAAEANRQEARNQREAQRLLEVLNRRVTQVEAIRFANGSRYRVRRGPDGAIDEAHLIELETRINRETAEREEQRRARSANLTARNIRRRQQAANTRRAQDESLIPIAEPTTDEELLRLLEESVRTVASRPRSRGRSQPTPAAPPSPPKIETPARDPFAYKRMVDLDDE